MKSCFHLGAVTSGKTANDKSILASFDGKREFQEGAVATEEYRGNITDRALLPSCHLTAPKTTVGVTKRLRIRLLILLSHYSL